MESHRTTNKLHPPPGRTYRGGAEEVDTRGLENALRRRVDGEIRFNDGDRALYATDASNYRQVPIGVVLPKSVEALAETVRVCAEYDAPIVHRGGGTALAGQTCNTAVVIDSSKYCRKVLDVDPDKGIAVVEPGIVLDDLQDAVRPHGLRFGPDPSTHSRCTIGGMIGNNSCGVHSLAYGCTVDNVEALEILTYDGLQMTVGRTTEEEYRRIQKEGGRRAEIYRDLRAIAARYGDRVREVFPDIPRRVSGYNLNQLLPERDFHVARALVGTESTCVTILRAHVQLQPEPPHRVLVVAGFENVCAAADAVPDIREGFEPLGCEGMDQLLTEYMRRKALHTEDLDLLPEGGGWLFVPFGGDDEKEVRRRGEEFIDWLKERETFTGARLHVDPVQQTRVWEIRESGLGATAFVPGEAQDTWPGWEDSAVPPERLGEYLRKLLELYDAYGYDASVYGHFGEGLVHTRINFGLHTQEEVKRYRAFIEDAARLVVDLNGSLSGEHGDGQARGELLPIMFGEEVVHAMQAFKHAWDPKDKMNPGKVVNARPLDVDLRLGPRFHPPSKDALETQFSYHHTDFSFVREAMRCVGVGKCRQTHTGTMCPSYRATREEKHSTRGRAHMLQEMLQGDPLTQGWDSPHVWEALDLCLACKACKRECPVDVDMATYKAEFAYHYFKTHRRPRAAWSMGYIHRWARLAAYAPWLANFGSQTPGLSALAKWVAGIHQDRAIPRFAPHTFRSGWTGDGTDRLGRRVVLFTDTFNNHFTPEPLRAAADVLEAAGCRVEIPRTNVCCGRPLYDFGFIPQARRLLEELMEGLREPVEDGAYIVGVEPTCMATFKDELVNLYPHDPLAKKLAEQAWMIGDFLHEVVNWDPPRISGRVRIHPHCNHRAIFGTEGEKNLLKATGAETEVLDSGCCGMAGSFGFEHDKYEVAQTILNDKLLPMVRNLDEAQLVASGFSCREQLRQATGVMYPSLPELLREGLRDTSAGRQREGDGHG